MLRDGRSRLEEQSSMFDNPRHLQPRRLIHEQAVADVRGGDRGSAREGNSVGDSAKHD